MALVYVKNEYRNKGFGALLCEKNQNIGKERGLKEIFLFTSTVESLYTRLGWQLLERLKSGGRIMQLFHDKVLLFYYVPAILNIMSHILVLCFCSRFSFRVALWSSMAMGLLSVSTTLFVIIPIQNDLPTLGLTPEINSKLLMYALFFQVLPAALQVMIAIGILNNHLKGTTLIGRLLFMAVFFLSVYSLGTFYMESMVGYPMWLLIDPSDWLATREAIGLNIPAFVWVFLIPFYLPLPLLVPMLWKRPNGIPKYPVLMMLFSILWIFMVTAVYFVP